MKVLITGSTDGIGLETAKEFLSLGHDVILHGRNPEKLTKIEEELSKLGNIESYIADLSSFSDTRKFTQEILRDQKSLDIIINNAGIYKTSKTKNEDGLDIRFVVNTYAPYIITKDLLPLLSENGRIVNLSSAAQASVSVNAMYGREELDDFEAYAQSKLAITMWSRSMAKELGAKGPVVVSINPASLLGSKMVKEGWGIEGKDMSIGVDILRRASFSDEFSDATGKYFDNDLGSFSDPHIDALNDDLVSEVVATIEDIINLK